MTTRPIPVRREHGTVGPQLRTASLRRRVALSVLGLLAVILIALLFVVDALFAAQSTRDAKAVLADRVSTAQQLARQVASPDQYIRRMRGQGVQAQLVTAAGEVYGSVPERAGDDPTMTRTIRLTGAAKPLAGSTLTLTVDTAAITNAQSRLRGVLVGVGIGALAVTAVVVVVVVRFALSPLDTMTELARSIAKGHRGYRLNPARRDTELGRTAAAFDDMLDALEGAETQARHAESVSRASEERTRRFVADAAHELRTPIAGLQAVAEATVQSGPEADPDERERMNLLLVREARRAGRLVDDLLALARIDAGLEVQHERLDLLALAQSEVERTRLLAADFDIAAEGTPVAVTGDPQRLAQVLANLVNNARQATGPDGRIRLRVAEPAPGWAELLVVDNGPGVPAEDRERIFDRLVRLDSGRDQRSGGSGLGLAIARGFARAHHGDLTCEAPAPGASGAVFRLVLPTAE